MVTLVKTVEDVTRNVRTLHRYASGTDDEKRFFAKRIKNGKNFVAVERNGAYTFAPSKFAGYKDNDTSHADHLRQRDGGVTDKRIANLLGHPYESGSGGHAQIDAAFVAYCRHHGFPPSIHFRTRRFWLIGTAQGATKTDSFSLPDEITNVDDVIEGALLRISVNRYERRPEARRRCVAHYGPICTVCEFSFEKTYGPLGAGYIHVHHLVPLSTIRKSYRVDPVKDLRPVCPNCHAMLHAGGRMHDIDELKALISKHRHRVAPAPRLHTK